MALGCSECNGPCGGGGGVLGHWAGPQSVTPTVNANLGLASHTCLGGRLIRNCRAAGEGEGFPPSAQFPAFLFKICFLKQTVSLAGPELTEIALSLFSGCTTIPSKVYLLDVYDTEGIGSLTAGVRGTCKPASMCWEPSAGPLEGCPPHFQL